MRIVAYPLASEDRFLTTDVLDIISRLLDLCDNVSSSTGWTDLAITLVDSLPRSRF